MNILFLAKLLQHPRYFWPPLHMQTCIVTNLMQPLFKRGDGITCDNFFISLDDVQRPAKEKCSSIVGTVRQNRKGVPHAPKTKQQLHETFVFQSQGEMVTSISYQCKKQKSLMIMSSTIHPYVVIPSHNSSKKEPEAVFFYTKTYVGLLYLTRWAGHIH